MTNENFCYWLQGHFELQAPDADLTSDQREIILRHIDVVEEHMRDRGGIGPAVIACRTLLHSVADASACTVAVRAIIHDVFLHVIDPKAGGPEQQAKLNNLHNPHPDYSKPVMRC